MKPTDIMLETTFGELSAALERGDFTATDIWAQRPRLGRAKAEREESGQNALLAVQAQDTNKKRKSRWKVEYLRHCALWLVQCGRAAWHVDAAGKITKVNRSAR